MRTGRFLLVHLAWLVLPCLSCVAPTSDERGERVSSAITDGVPDGDGGAQTDGGLDPVTDAVVAIVRDGGRICTGALVTESMVLTARHCVSRTNGLGVRCTIDGPGDGGQIFLADEAPSSLRVFVGRKPDLAGAPAAFGRKAFSSGAETPCDNDLAVLVLDRAISGVRPLPVRLHGRAREGETFRAIGYGKTEQGTIGERRRRDGVRVLGVGPLLTASKTALGPRELEASQSFCDGDSGGPAISAAGAVVGVVSRGPACEEASGYVYAMTSGFRDVFAEAEKLAGGVVAGEPGDVPGDASTEDDEGDAADASSRPARAYDRGLPARCSFVVPRPGRAAPLVVLAAAIAIACVRRRTRVRATCSRSAQAARDACNLHGDPG